MARSVIVGQSLVVYPRGEGWVNILTILNSSVLNILVHDLDDGAKYTLSNFADGTDLVGWLTHQRVVLPSRHISRSWRYGLTES